MPLAASRRRCTTTVQFLGRLSRRQITKLGKHLVTKLGKHWSQVFGTRLKLLSLQVRTACWRHQVSRRAPSRLQDWPWCAR
jgi:hypothetical protein